MPSINDTNTQEPLLKVDKEKDSTQDPRPQVHLFKSQIILNPTISKLNFFAFLLFSTYLGAIIIPANLLLLPLLNNVYGLTYDERINVTTIVQLTQLGVKLLICPVLGYLCDKHGRRIFVIVGVVFLCSSIALMPNLPAVYPYYILIQVGFEIGMMSQSAAPLLADYIDYETKGRVAGLSAVISYAASSVTTYIVSKIDLEENIPSKLHEVAILGAVIGFIVVLGLKGGSYHKELFYDRKAEEAKRHVPEMIAQEQQLEEEEHKKSFEAKRSKIASKVKVRPDPKEDSTEDLVENSDIQRVVVDVADLNLNESFDSRQPNQATRSRATQLENYKPGLMAGIREAKRSPWILTGYISSFLCFSYVMLVNTSLVNYCTEKIGATDGPNQAYALTNKHMIVSCFTAIFFGFFADKLNKFKILMFVVICSIASVLFLLFSPTPYNAMAYVSMVLFGIACSGYMTITSQLTSKYADPKYRASVSAVSSICTMLGGAVVNIIGVYLSKVDVSIPYYIYLGCAAVGFVLLVIIYSKKKNILNNL